MLGLVSHAACQTHDTGPLHPESPDRLDAINDRLIASGLEMVVRHFEAPRASPEQLELVHDPAYVARVIEASPKEGYVELDGDTVMSPGTLEAALRAAGSGILGTDLVMRGEACPVFCAVRPPGHHAERARAMGFCLFNNVAIAAAHALEHHGLSRVAVCDFDVHHGNGTEQIVAGDPRILLCSSFQHPFYPHTGHASDAPNLVAVPLPAGTDGPAFRREIERHWLPALDDFAPELILVSAGFDAHALDDMSGLSLMEADFSWITRTLVEVADRHAEGRIVSMLEGGYEPGALGRSVVAHLKALMKQD